MTKPAHQSERRKQERTVGLDRRKHDDDLAERMIGGVRTWSPKTLEPDTAHDEGKPEKQ